MRRQETDPAENLLPGCLVELRPRRVAGERFAGAPDRPGELRAPGGKHLAQRGAQRDDERPDVIGHRQLRALLNHGFDLRAAPAAAGRPVARVQDAVTRCQADVRATARSARADHSLIRRSRSSFRA